MALSAQYPFRPISQQQALPEDGLLNISRNSTASLSTAFLEIHSIRMAILQPVEQKAWPGPHQEMAAPGGSLPQDLGGGGGGSILLGCSWDFHRLPVSLRVERDVSLWRLLVHIASFR